MPLTPMNEKTMSDNKALFKEALQKAGFPDYSFTKRFINITVNLCEDYEDIKDFFNDMYQGGCQSGMVPDFIYDDDCKKFYIKHIDDLEDYVQELGAEPQTSELKHYTWVCWVCYEEFIRTLAQALWPDEF